MEVIQTSVFWTSLLEIIWINLLLSGDNAVVIALAARTLEPVRQRQAVIWGTVGAVIMRILLTLFAVKMLTLPWLRLIGAVLLVWIGAQLLVDEDDSGNVKAGTNLLDAIKTILVADLVMSLDNVIGVAGAANSAPPAAQSLLLVFGLGLSIPIVIFGSGIVLRLMTRIPAIVTLGGMLLGWIGGEMAATDPFVVRFVGTGTFSDYGLPVVGALLVLIVAYLSERRNAASVDDAGS
jgi:YjbE family integral membrane protein